MFLIGILQEKAVLAFHSEALFQFSDLFYESLFSIDFVRKHTELEVEKFLGLRVLEFLRFIHLGPDVVDVFFQSFLEEFAVASRLNKVSDAEHQFFGA